MGFKDIALPMAAKGVPMTPVRPDSKKAFLPNFPETATTDTNQILAWDAAYPNHNGACVARAHLGAFWFFEVDSPDVVKRIREETGMEIPTTFRVRSRPGRGHFYFKHTPASLAMGNISQAYVKNGDWSARADNMYVVAAGSIHPHSKDPYTALNPGDPIVEAPDWLVQWLLSQKTDGLRSTKAPAGEIERDAHGLIPHGHIHGYMLKEAGKLRNQGLGAEAIEVALHELVHKNCAPPIDDSKIKQMAHSICNFPAGRPSDLLLTQKSAVAPEITQPEEEEELPTFEEIPYPKFPTWVMHGTSIYEKFVKPYCEHNSRIDYFMWFPAMIALLNYVGPKIKIKCPFGSRPFKGSVFAVMIGRKGKTNKSSSVGEAMDYFNYAGMLSHGGKDFKAAEGKVVTFTPGSMEGLGLQMDRSNCKNALVIYDELQTMVAKASIESSTLVSQLLTVYEANKFTNGIKATKETFSIEPNTYCVSLIANTTDKKFTELWSRIAGKDAGLDDRFMFVLQPDPLPEPKLHNPVNTVGGSVETKKLIDKAITQGVYGFEEGDPHPGMTELVNIENRLAARAEKWALGIAIDLGLDIIDDECVARGVEIVKYELKVREWLKSYEASTREGQIQQEVRRILERNRGLMFERDLLREIHADRHGTSLWGQAYGGLFKALIIRKEGTGKKGDPFKIRLLVKREREDE